MKHNKPKTYVIVMWYDMHLIIINDIYFGWSSNRMYMGLFAVSALLLFVIELCTDTNISHDALHNSHNCFLSSNVIWTIGSKQDIHVWQFLLERFP